MLIPQAKIEELIKDKIGIAASVIGSNKIAKAIETRRLACGLPDLQSYLNRLQTSKPELEELIEHIVVPETWFFRDRKPFAFLESHIKTEWLINPNKGILRLLSIPCSSGEEPYSIAITLLNAGLTPNQFRIDAVDISKQALLKAQRAVYQKNSCRGEDLSGKERYFQQTSDGYELSQLVRNTVNFIHGNLLDPVFLNNKKYNVIFCRNLLIYFESDACSEVMKILDRLLIPNGLLFVGSAETVRIPTDGFVSVRYPFSFAYRKLADSPLNTKTNNTNTSTNKVINITQKVELKPISTVSGTQSKPKSPSPTTMLQTARNLADGGHLDEAAT